MADFFFLKECNNIIFVNVSYCYCYETRFAFESTYKRKLDSKIAKLVRLKISYRRGDKNALFRKIVQAYLFISLQDKNINLLAANFITPILN